MIKSLSKWQGFSGTCQDSCLCFLIFCADNQCFIGLFLPWVLLLMTGKYEILLK